MKIIIRGCHNLIPYLKLVEAGFSVFPPGVEAGLLPCSSKLEPAHIIKFFEYGADGVLILACPLGTCHFVEGNRVEKRRIAWVAHTLEELGLDPARIKFLMVEPEQAQEIAGIIKDFYSTVSKLGPTPIKGRSQVLMADRKPQARGRAASPSRRQGEE